MNSKSSLYGTNFLGNNYSSIFNDLSTRNFKSVKIGESAGKLLMGSNNVFVGYQAALHALNTSNSVILGAFAGQNIQNGTGNTLIGSFTGYNMQNGSYNTISGFNSGTSIINGHYNTIFGFNTGTSNHSGNNNCIFGTNSGNGIVDTSYNVIIGNNCANGSQYGFSNIFIGSFIDTNQTDIKNTIIIGNNSQSYQNSVMVGNDIISNTLNNISVGSIMNINSIAIIQDPLVRNDAIILTNAKNRFPTFDTISATPNSINNLIYTPLNNLITSKTISLLNNVKTSAYTFTIPTHTVQSSITTTVTQFLKQDVTDSSSNTIYEISSPFITPNSTYTNSIDLNTISVSAKYSFQFYVLQQPKYGSILNPSQLYEPSSTIQISEYPEAVLQPLDTINITTSISGMLSTENVIIPLSRKSYKVPPFNTMYIGPPGHTYVLYNNNFPQTNVYTIVNNSSIRMFENNILQISRSLYPNNIENITLIGEGSITLNNTNLTFNTLQTYNETSYSIELIFMSILEPYSVSHNIRQPPSSFIYVEIPPQNGYFNLGNYFQISSISDLVYIPISTYGNDTCSIRFVNNNMISNVLFSVSIKNYIARVYDLMHLPSTLPISDSLSADGYYWNGYSLSHPNKPTLAVYNPSAYMPATPTFIYNPITLKSNAVKLSVFPFATVSILNPILQAINYVKETPRLNIITPPKYGYIDTNNVYHNTTNLDDSFQVLPTYGIIDAFSINVITVTVSLINTLNLTVKDQYIYSSDFILDTISCKETSNIFLTTSNVTYSILNASLIQTAKQVTRSFVVTFDQHDYVLPAYFPTIQHTTYRDFFIYKQTVPNTIFNYNQIDYTFTESINQDFTIRYSILPTTIFPQSLPFDTFKYYMYLSSNVLEFSHDSISVNGQTFDVNIPFNVNTEFTLNNTSIQVNTSNSPISIIPYNLGPFSNIQFVYLLNDNIHTCNLPLMYDLENYLVTLNIQNFELSVSTNQQDSYNLSIGNNIAISGLNNICIGKTFNTFGNNSIIIGSSIGNANTQLFDGGLHESIIIGNNSFQKSLVKNTISIGNNMLNNLVIQTASDYNVASDFFSRSPILIGNSISYNPSDVINIGNTFKELSSSIEIGNNNKDINLKGNLINSTITDILTRLSVLESKVA